MAKQDSLTFYTDSNHQLYKLADYAIFEKLGQGSYGRVYLARNKQNKYLYAIKKFKIENGFPTTTLREIALLKILQHPNIVSFYQVLITENKCYMVLEYMLMSLDVFIKTKDISLNLVKSFMFQLLQGILFCHNRNVLHRDMKPQNVLVHHNMKVVKLSDFGLARKVSISSIQLTPNVVTFDYRSPELLMNKGNYSKGVDIWSIGCIFVEMIQKEPPFRGNVELDMWLTWFIQLGIPKEEELVGITSMLNLTKIPLDKNTKNHMKLFKSKVGASAFDLVTKMFIYNQAKRIDACEALHHDYFKDFDSSTVPAINEENVGYPTEHRITKEAQLLRFTLEDMDNLSDAGEKHITF